MRGVGHGSSWRWFWIARRQGRADWSEASTVREAIRRATLLPPRKPPGWLSAAAAEAERQIIDPVDAHVTQEPPPPS